MWERVHNFPLWLMIIARFLPFFPNSAFLIMKSCSKSTVESKIRFRGSLRGGVPGVSVGTSIFGWFLGGFGWFLLVEDNFEWFQVVWCFSSYTNCTAYRRVNSLVYSWSHVIDWDHASSSFKIKLQKIYYCCVVVLQSAYKWLLHILYCVLCQIKNFF